MIRGLRIAALLFSFAARANEIVRAPIRMPARPVVETDEPTRYRQDRFQVAAEFSMLTPTITETSTQTERKSGGVPIGFAAARFPLFRIGEWQTTLIPKVGMGTNRGVFQVSQAGTRYSEELRLLIVPIALSFEVSFPIAGFPFLKPALSVGVGEQYTAQEGGGGGRKQFWTPFVTARPALIFLQNTSADDFFGGFSFGVTRWWGVGPTRVSSWSVDTALFFNL